MSRVKEIKLNEGDLQLFKGRYAVFTVQQEQRVCKYNKKCFLLSIRILEKKMLGLVGELELPIRRIIW